MKFAQISQLLLIALSSIASHDGIYAKKSTLSIQTPATTKSIDNRRRGDRRRRATTFSSKAIAPNNAQSVSVL